jgi:hypothetical protein
MKSNLSLLTATGLLFAASHMHAQATGTAHPESLDDNITVSKPQPVKPSPAVQITTPALHERTEPVTVAVVAPGPVEAARVITPASSHIIMDDDNSGIVTEVPSAANELPEGTVLRTKLSQEISTRNTEPNIRFNAFISTPIEKHGRIVIPAGSVLTGRITELSTGHHVGKAAGIHLQPEFITLPNGEHYKLNGQVIDLTSDHHTRVTREGTIMSNDPAPGMATAVGVSTGAGAITGAILGGGVGAVVGAGIGAGVSGTVWAKQETNATLRAGTEIIFSLNQTMLLENANIAN